MVTRLAREAQTAVLAVGEGKSELALLAHLKSIYCQRNCGVSVKIKGGMGKGGMHVLNYAIGQAQGIAYDRVIVLLDTDTDWSDAQRAKAKRKKCDVVESTPCLEAWLLQIHGDEKERSTEECKREFKRRFGLRAHDVDVYPRHFDSGRLAIARGKVTVLERLLTLLGVSPG